MSSVTVISTTINQHDKPKTIHISLPSTQVLHSSELPVCLCQYHKLRVLFVWANVKAETTGLGPPEKEGLGPLPVPNP